MLVRVVKIPAEGMDARFSVPVTIMRSSLSKTDDLWDVLDNDVDCELHLQPMSKDIFLEGGVDSRIHPICARCNEPFDSTLSLNLNLTLSPEPKSAVPGTDSYQESDEGIVFFRHQEIDLAEIVREQVLLSLPMRFLCRDDCRGLCSRCGANLNLGDHACKASSSQVN